MLRNTFVDETMVHVVHEEVDELIDAEPKSIYVSLVRGEMQDLCWRPQAHHSHRVDEHVQPTRAFIGLSRRVSYGELDGAHAFLE